MKPILLEGLRIGLAKQPLGIGLVIGEEPVALVAAGQPIGTDPTAGMGEHRIAFKLQGSLLLIGVAPAPGVAQPEGG